MKKYLDETVVDQTTGEENKSVKIKIGLNQQKIEKDEMLDGYYIIVTSETELSLSEIISRYRGLWRIEQSFRISKSELRGRPVFVRTSEHINAHFLICFITLTMLRMLEIRTQRKYSSTRIIDALKSTMATDIGKDIYQLNKKDEIICELEKMLGLEFNNRYVRKESLLLHKRKIQNSVYTTA